jgi:hypothetical protein
MKSPDHYLDFYATADSFQDYIKNPALFVYAWPPSYGERSYKSTIDFVGNMKATSKHTLDMVEFNGGTHHFHMIDPKKTSELILDFLEKIKPPRG